jgi:hypothetical protein
MYRMIEERCKEEGVSDPLDLTSPRLEHSDLQGNLEARASDHAKRDRARGTDSDPPDYHNGALFGFDPEIPPDEQDERWVVSVTPRTEYIDIPRLAGSAWKHTERRHQEGS